MPKTPSAPALGNSAPPSPAPKKKKKRNRPKVAITMNKELRDFAKEHFPKTGYKDLSGFIEAKIKQFVRNERRKIIKKKTKLPQAAFEE